MKEYREEKTLTPEHYFKIQKRKKGINKSIMYKVDIIPTGILRNVDLKKKIKKIQREETMTIIMAVSH